METFSLLNFDAPTSPRLTLRDVTDSNLPTHWGLSYYPSENKTATTIKSGDSLDFANLFSMLENKQDFRSTLFLFKSEDSSKNIGPQDIQPFHRSFAGNEWVFLHQGQIDRKALENRHKDDSGFLTPIGTSGSELLFCHLLSLIDKSGFKSLTEINGEFFQKMIASLNVLGSLNLILSDRKTIFLYRGKNTTNSFYLTRILPPRLTQDIHFPYFSLRLDDPKDMNRTSLLVAPSPPNGADALEMVAGQLIIARQASIIWNSHPETSLSKPLPEGETTEVPADPYSRIVNIKTMTCTSRGQPLLCRGFQVTHTTQYNYTLPVEYSTHIFRLLPIEDGLQEVVTTELTLSVPGEKTVFEDVFGNTTVHYVIDQPYTSLEIRCLSYVKLFEAPPDDYSRGPRKNSLPILWMPWQRQMMLSYLLPPELPETQLQTLTDYALSFVQRNDGLLIETLNDINRTLYQDYEYVQGSTHMDTTPFEVFTRRKGVCQDFANLFICLARLLNIPARYHVGYIFTGSHALNTVQSEASHAWVEVYLPYIGWRGFDPTNGCRVSQNHIRVASGRNYRDATPTTGTIFKGGSSESMFADVKIFEHRF